MFGAVQKITAHTGQDKHDGCDCTIYAYTLPSHCRLGRRSKCSVAIRPRHRPPNSVSCSFFGQTCSRVEPQIAESKIIVFSSCDSLRNQDLGKQRKTISSEIYDTYVYFVFFLVERSDIEMRHVVENPLIFHARVEDEPYSGGFGERSSQHSDIAKTLEREGNIVFLRLHGHCWPLERTKRSRPTKEIALDRWSTLASNKKCHPRSLWNDAFANRDENDWIIFANFNITWSPTKTKRSADVVHVSYALRHRYRRCAQILQVQSKWRR